jgi:hypothetical protein
VSAVHFTLSEGERSPPPPLGEAQRRDGHGDAHAVAPCCAIFCGPRTSEVARLATSIYRAQELTWPMTLWTPRRLENEFGWTGEVPGLALRFDEEVKGFDQVAEFLREHHAQGRLGGRSTGWYLQQYLKLAVAWEAGGPVFIHDGDTIFSPGLMAEQMHSPFLMTTKEGTDRYSAAAQAVGLPTHPRSFVANGGLFIPEVLRSLDADPATWFMDVMARGVLGEGAQGDFSEYQIMGALLTPRLPARPITIFRRFDLLVSSPARPDARRKVVLALKRYDALAFESGHRASAARRFLGLCAYGVGYSW